MRETLLDTSDARALLVGHPTIAAPVVIEPAESDGGLRPSDVTRAERRAAFAVKRCLDLLGATFVLLLVLPVLATIAAIVALTSEGPAIYRSRRVGRDGQEFDCFKLRTMVQGADRMQDELESSNQADGPLFKIDGDPRVTPIGAWLRRTSLDELPQLWNVLRGEMSLVGPRPLPLRDVTLLGPDDHRRHDVRPGMTGVWQVSPDRHGSGNDIIELDLAYIDGWSLRGDLVLLLRTAFVVLDGVIGRRGELD